MRSLMQRRLVYLVGGVLALTSLAACSSSGSTGSSGGSGGSAGEDLSVVTPTEPVTMNPIESVITDARVWGAIFDPLVDVNEQGVPQNTGLITAWKETSPKSWTLTLRSGVKFQDGEPFDAAAVKYTLEQYAKDPESKMATYVGEISSVKAVSATDLEVDTVEPYNALPMLLSAMYPVPPKYYQEKGAAKFAKDPVGTGPFKLSNYTSGQKVIVVRNSDYWRGPAKLKQITFTWSSDASSRVSLLQGGSADVIIDLPVQQIASLSKDSAIQVTSEPETSAMAIFFETGNAPFNNPTWRKAAALAINRDAIVKSLFSGTGAKVQTHLFGQLMAPAPTPTYTDQLGYDPTKAKALLAGQHPKITFSYTVGRYPQDNLVGQAVVGMLQAVGFDVKANPMDVAKFFELQGKHQLGSYMFQIAPVFLHPDVYVHGFLTSKSITQNCIDPKMDAMSNQALSAKTTAESDSIYGKLEDYALNQKVCNVILYSPVGYYGLAKDVQGFVPPADQVPNWYDVSLGK